MMFVAVMNNRWCRIFRDRSKFRHFMERYLMDFRNTTIRGLHMPMDKDKDFDIRVYAINHVDDPDKWDDIGTFDQIVSDGAGSTQNTEKEPIRSGDTEPFGMMMHPDADGTEIIEPMPHEPKPPSVRMPIRPHTRWRKVPVVIDAFRITGDRMRIMTESGGSRDWPGNWPEWLVRAWSPHRYLMTAGAVFHDHDPNDPNDPMGAVEDRKLTIRTLEGAIFCPVGSWIIRGVKGELYPCRDDIFRKTYEEV